ncbi:hypothetical protein M758_5G026700 [Ceratodon purpureus]|nr:hypothetical protein M758_5G026700 [Ceratodon purpureus]
MASLWVPSVSSQMGFVSTSLPQRNFAVGLRAGVMLGMNSRLSYAPLRRCGCPSLVVRASAIDAATALSKVTEDDEIGHENGTASSRTRSSNAGMDGPLSSEDQKEMGRQKMNRICDKLIEVFLVEKTNPEEWHIYLAFSKEWVNLRPHFFSRCKFQAAQTEDLKRRSNLLVLSRRLKELDEDMQQHDKLLALIEKSPTKIDAIVARQRKDFTEHFFEHLRIRIQASYDDQNRREEIAAIAKDCLAAVQEYDKNAKDFMSLSAAQMKFDDIVKSPSLEVASKKIESLAKKGELDSSLMLLISKAYSASKESTLMKEEAKDTMLQLYNVARGNMSRLVPKEVRILRYLLSINDPQERSAEMKNAFTPGLEMEGKDVDELYT